MSSQKNIDVINCKLGKASTPKMMTLGYGFIVACILPILTLTLTGFVVAFLMFIFGGFLAFTTSGVDLDTSNKKINNYLVYFGIYKTLNWVEIKDFNYITVLVFNDVHSIKKNAKKSTQRKDLNYEIYLIDNTKENRQILATSRHARSAIDLAKKIAERLEIRYINYHPEKGWE